MKPGARALLEVLSAEAAAERFADRIDELAEEGQARLKAIRQRRDEWAVAAVLHGGATAATAVRELEWVIRLLEGS